MRYSLLHANPGNKNASVCRELGKLDDRGCVRLASSAKRSQVTSPPTAHQAVQLWAIKPLQQVQQKETHTSHWLASKQWPASAAQLCAAQMAPAGTDIRAQQPLHV